MFVIKLYTHSRLSGIPYAAPPQRWKKSVPPASWTGIKRTTISQAGCIQNNGGFALWPGHTSEDCVSNF
jgi:para-nitrobenzyl esterase